MENQIEICIVQPVRSCRTSEVRGTHVGPDRRVGWGWHQHLPGLLKDWVWWGFAQCFSSWFETWDLVVVWIWKSLDKSEVGGASIYFNIFHICFILMRFLKGQFAAVACGNSPGASLAPGSRPTPCTACGLSTSTSTTRHACSAFQASFHHGAGVKGGWQWCLWKGFSWPWQSFFCAVWAMPDVSPVI